MTSWIQSGGGPLVCIERAKAHQWLGVNGSGSKKHTESDFLNDYESACSVQDYLGIVQLPRGAALVLGDMPLETRISYRHGSVPRIVRIFYADQGADVVEKLERAQEFDNVAPIETIEAGFSESELVIFDSAYPYSEVGNAFLTFSVEPGQYSILTKKFEPDGRTSLLVHEFRRCVS